MKLLLLRCPNCGEPLQAENDDVVVACANCFTPVAISVNGPVKMKVQFGVSSGAAAGAGDWLPFWAFDGQVQIRKRETQGGSSKSKDANKLWGAPRRFWVPAWDLDLKVAQELGGRLVQAQPEFQKIDPPPGARLTTAIVTPKDAKKLIEFIILAVEARRSDWLRDIDFDFKANEPQLWALQERSYR